MRDDAVLRRALPLGRGLGRPHDMTCTCVTQSHCQTALVCETLIDAVLCKWTLDRRTSHVKDAY